MTRAVVERVATGTSLALPFDEAGAPYANYDVARESDGFIMVRSDEELSASRLVVVLNWFEELRRLVPTGH